MSMDVEEVKRIGTTLFKSGWQTRFAEFLGITPQHFRRYLSGKTIIPESKVRQIRMMDFLKKKGLWEEYVSKNIINNLRDLR
tara:strand:- start:207 stop:452 length:246 start_codon:yes stop_codon:yes gene_type:complete